MHGALGEVTADHPDHARHLYQLALLQSARSAVAGRSAAARAADRAAADEALGLVADSAGTPPMLRLDAFQYRAQRQQDPAAALADYERAVACVPLLAWHGLSRTDRERLLRELSALTQNAAAAALDAGRPERAVELLEHGRTVLWNQALDLAADMTALSRAEPERAARLTRTRTELQALDTGSGTPYTPHSQTADRRMALAREWDELTERVRQEVPGFRDFLLPPRFGELRRAADRGPVVLINVAGRRCDALAVTRTGVRTVPLDITGTEITRAATDYVSDLEACDQPDATEEDYDRLGRTTESVLARMWEAVASPVLDALGLNSPPGNDSWPRVWWCPTGPLAFLPFHAMGLHAPGAPPGTCVLDRVVSSYTPTLRALVRSRDRRPPGSGRRRMLMVAMEQTPGMRSLPHARDELRLVRAHFADACTVRSGPEASRAAVLGELGGHSWAHFCCHGDMAPRSPSDSGIELYDARLTVGDIAGLDLEEAEFAFLPSCRTAVSDFGLPDEAIHISAALHFAGYRHVVATLWSVYDRFATYIADHVYASVVANGTLDAERTALALHEAVRELRREPGMELICWTPFIHTGP